jgi:hypothetical protein
VNGSATIGAPIPPATLVKQVQRLGELLDDLVPMLQPGLAPGFEILKRNVRLALERPESLESPENQLDFVEEFAEALWGEPFPDLLGDAGSSWTGVEKALDRARLEASWEQLESISEHLCGDVERWHRKRALASCSGMGAPC